MQRPCGQYLTSSGQKRRAIPVNFIVWCITWPHETYSSFFIVSLESGAFLLDSSWSYARMTLCCFPRRRYYLRYLIII